MTTKKRKQRQPTPLQEQRAILLPHQQQPQPVIPLQQLSVISAINRIAQREQIPQEPAQQQPLIPLQQQPAIQSEQQ
jgi:hypothetical protein